MTHAEPTISIRILWPFARLRPGDPRWIPLLADLSVGASDLVFDRRLSAKATFNILRRAVEVFDDPTMGLRAGALTDQGTFGVLEHGAAASENLRAAIEFVARHMRVLSEASESWLTVEGDKAFFWYAARLPHPAGSNDLIVSAAIGLVRRLCSPEFAPLEVWLVHPETSYVDAYTEHWRCPVRFGAQFNAVVFDAAWLDRPMVARSPEMAEVFERKATRITAALSDGGTLRRRVQERLGAQLAIGAVSMAQVARSLGLSTATLRRRLEEEGASFSAILDEVRLAAARRYLRGSQLNITEIAHLLAFTQVRAFARAFRRWTGQSPTEFRETPPD